jgi:hypothetical protein
MSAVSVKRTRGVLVERTTILEGTRPMTKNIYHAEWSDFIGVNPFKSLHVYRCRFWLVFILKE